MAGRPKTVATISSLQLIVNHFMSAPLAEAKHDIDVAQAIVIGRAKASGSTIPTGVPAGGSTPRKRDRSRERANRVAAAGGAATEGATEGTGEAPKRRRGRPSNASKGNGAETPAGDAGTQAAADVTAPPLPDPGGPMGDDHATA